MSGWKYYNHAAIPTCAPHERVDTTDIEDGAIWSIYPKALLARWTSDWDCGYETNWWYVIKDTPFDISSLKAKRRYEINKGNKNFEVRLIKPSEMIADIYRVTVSAYKGWPEKYRPAVTEKQICENVKRWDNSLVFGAFLRDNGILQGYAIIENYKNYAAFSILRTNPETESLGINAAIVDGILSEFKDRFHDGFYICDGSRAIMHETFFQDYLEKYFDFRKAYCKLNIKYKPRVGMIVKVLYPFRSLIGENTGISSKISGVLKMEEIYRNK